MGSDKVRWCQTRGERSCIVRQVYAKVRPNYTRSGKDEFRHGQTRSGRFRHGQKMLAMSGVVRYILARSGVVSKVRQGLAFTNMVRPGKTKSDKVRHSQKGQKGHSC